MSPRIIILVFYAAPSLLLFGPTVARAQSDRLEYGRPVSCLPAYVPSEQAAEPCPSLPCVDPCGPPGQCWVRAEYLAWWARGSRVPVLATASPPGTPVNQAGVLGVPGTVPLFGQDPIDAGMRSGIRVRAGGWFDCDRTCGFEIGFFWLGNPPSGSFAAGSDGNAIISRPFLDATTGLPSAENVSYPGLLAGTVSVNSRSTFLGADPMIRHRLCCVTDCVDPCDPCASQPGYWRFDLLAGYRFFYFQDSVTITEDLMPLTPQTVPGTRIVVRDEFQASNQFHGVSLGLAVERGWGKCFVAGEARINAGATVRDVTITGQTVVSVPGDVTAVNPGGLYALPTNIGSYRSCEFTVAPEFDFRIGYQFTPRLRGFVGYTLIIWPNVARAGEQIDTYVNPFLLPPPVPNAPGPARPTFLDRTSTLWVQGVSVGFEYRW